MAEEIQKIQSTQTAVSTKSDEELLKERKEKVAKFLKEKYTWISYVLLAIIVYLSVKIRTANLDKLRDITTGTWTLGPDLDPFLFLRWAKYIIEHGSLMTVDAMRYVPVGYDTRGELILHPYMIAWFHKIATYFGSQSVTESAVLYPVFFFAITVIAFFFMVRKMFVDELGEKAANIIALIASFFFTVIPSLLPRTIAGIPEKESAAFFFMFAAFYFFISSWKAKKNVARYSFAVLAGLSTGAMALVWGGVAFLFLTISLSVFVAFVLGQSNKERLYAYGLFLITSFALMSPFSTRYTLKDFVTSIDTGSAFAVFFVIAIHLLIFNTRIKNYFKSEKLSKIPEPLISTVIAGAILVIGATLLLGFSFIISLTEVITSNLIKPATTRLIQTVAENKQPHFTEWAGSYGPQVRGIPLTFWLFFIGSVYLFHKVGRILKPRERWTLTFSYLMLLIGLIFSRYSDNSILTGENNVSLFLYALGFLVFIGVFGYYLFKYYKNKEYDALAKIDFGHILLFALFILTLLAARGAVRLVLMLVLPASILVGCIVVVLVIDSRKIKKGVGRIVAFGITGLVIISAIFSGYAFYKESAATAAVYAPSIYNQQWQKAMAWVRESTPQNAVFSHWWDYGYWIQSIGERATVLDGGNGISYWNHMMGRYALTGTNNTEALEFLYAHNVTHFLIDSTDIGKYAAFSSIGSDVTYDRASFIPEFQRDPEQIQQKKNSTVFLYRGGIGLDGDITYEDNNTKIFLPAGQAGLGGIYIEENSSGKMVSQPKGIFVYQGKQYTIPLRYAYHDGKFIDFEKGIEAGVFIFPRAIQNGQGVQIDKEGAMLYLSKRTVKSQLARLYLYNENNTDFKLAHSEDDFLVAQIKAQNPEFKSDFVEFGGIRGPIRIWEVNYPQDIELKKEYLSTDYPTDIYYAK